MGWPTWPVSVGSLASSVRGAWLRRGSAGTPPPCGPEGPGVGVGVGASARPPLRRPPLRRSRAGFALPGGRTYHDPFFADPAAVEDDYRRMRVQ
jgi:hypothetical protein